MIFSFTIKNVQTAEKDMILMGNIVTQEKLSSIIETWFSKCYDKYGGHHE